MPMIEHVPIAVRLTVEVDGHTLVFEEKAEPRGARYHGKQPPSSFMRSELERTIRTAVSMAALKAMSRNTETMIRLYPLCDDHADLRPSPTNP